MKPFRMFLPVKPFRKTLPLKPFHRLLQSAAVWPFLLIGIFPLGLLLIRGLRESLRTGQAAAVLFDPGRELVLFLKTVAYAGAVAAAVTGIGILAAIFVCGPGKRFYHQLTWILFIAVPVPACVHALAWLKWSAIMNKTGFLAWSSRGWVMSWFVESMALLPIGVLIIAGGVLTINKEQIMAARLLGSDAKFLARLLPRYLQPQIMATAAIVLILAINDYAIPSIFSVNVYALEIFVEYSSSLSVSRTILKSIPLMALQIIILIAILNVIAQVFLSGKSGEFAENNLVFPKLVNWLAGLAMVLVAVQIAGPGSVILLDQQMWLELGHTLTSTAPDLATSLLIGVVAVVAGVPVIYATAVWLNRTRFKQLGLFIVLLPSVLPAALMGAAYINMFNQPQTTIIYNSILMPALAVLARFMPFGVIITLAWIKRLDPDLLHAAEILEGRTIRNALLIKLPMIATGLLLGSALIFLFCLGELGATVLVLPPGLSTVTVRLYNYLHYGASEQVQGLSFILLAIIGLLAGLGMLLSRRKAP